MSRIKGFFVIPALALGLSLGSISLAHAEDNPGEKFNEGAKDAWEKTKAGMGQGMEQAGEGMKKAGEGMKSGGAAPPGEGMKKAGDGMEKAGESMQE